MIYAIAAALLVFLAGLWWLAIWLGRNWPGDRPTEALATWHEPRIAPAGRVASRQMSCVPLICQRCLQTIKGPVRIFNDEFGTSYECFAPCKSPVEISEPGEQLRPLQAVDDCLYPGDQGGPIFLPAEEMRL